MRTIKRPRTKRMAVAAFVMAVLATAFTAAAADAHSRSVIRSAKGDASPAAFDIVRTSVTRRGSTAVLPDGRGPGRLGASARDGVARW
ncbi:MAG: hypothetical protein ABIM89_17375 [Mycobacteriales bacterium]